MVELSREKLANAINRCKQLRPLVAAVSVEGREYLVESSDKMTMHTVRLSKQGGRKFADCGCKAGRQGMACFHVAAAATLHIGLMRQRAAH
jgi:hypothetical protein